MRKGPAFALHLKWWARQRSMQVHCRYRFRIYAKVPCPNAPNAQGERFRTRLRTAMHEDISRGHRGTIPMCRRHADSKRACARNKCRSIFTNAKIASRISRGELEEHPLAHTHTHTHT
eukprot:6820964-Prymnesium_polylepis.1